jgi:alpha-amylase/alpha-mannosidase (GH57 family)
MNRYVCIHGHFYQPPRENPWLEYVELQDSAYPYHDWNERINAECYAPNGRSRILNPEGKIAELVNNYSWMSFNVGPTLLAWLAEQAPDVYQVILQGDRESRQRFSGHGSGLAQPYNHMILPLSNPRDIVTQIVWGIEDFRHRFERDPEGMWLPETAVDTRSLEALAKRGIRFTILAPNQAKRVRPIGARTWIDVSGGRIDPTMPYLVRLPSGARITIFIYDGPISRALAFEDLLDSGEAFADRLTGAFRDDRNHPQIVNIATDGETYGHHRRHAEMALSYATRKLEGGDTARMTNYGEYLAAHPPTFELEIFDNSSWSCVHGVERWRNDCGCNSGMNPGWRQEWRAPLRAALDYLRDQLSIVFEKEGRDLFRNPWKARDAYIDVILDRSPENRARFLAAQGFRKPSPDREIRACQLLEMQRHAMLMYTSCGWFFDELSGIETVQIIAYAARALQLATQITGQSLEEEFLDRLRQAKSNLPEHSDGRAIYLKWIKPAMVDLGKVAAHYAVSSLFEPYQESTRVYSHQVTRENHTVDSAGRRKLGLGRIHVRSEITQESATFAYGVLHLGDHNVSGGVRPYQGPEKYTSMKAEIVEFFQREDVPDLIRAVDRQFGDESYSLRFLFRDEQHKIVRILLESALEEASGLYRSFYREYGPLARFLTEIGSPVPHRFSVAIDFALHQDLQTALSRDDVAVERVQPVLEQVRRSGVSPEEVSLEFAFRQVLEKCALRWQASPDDADAVEDMNRVLDVLDILPFKINLWMAQNAAYDVVKGGSRRASEQSGAIALRLGVVAGQGPA